MTGPHHDLMAHPVLLPEGPANAELEAGTDPAAVAAQYPTSSAAWAELAEQALDADQPVTAYAYARTGYHRGLDALRKAGWKGHGLVPWEHAPNRGVLRSIKTLARAAKAIGETDEVNRLQAMLADADPSVTV